MDQLPPDAVGRILESNAAWHRRDLNALLASYADEIVWDTTDAWPDGRVYRGLPAFRAYCQEVLERWGEDEHRLEIEEIFAIEETASVLIHYRMLGRSHAGIPLDVRWVHVLEFRDDGRVVAGRNFTSLDEAIESLGKPPLARLWESAAGERPEQIVAFARDLVAIPTENPPGGAAHDECVQRICAELDSLAIGYEVVETGDEEARRQAILATVGESGPLLYLHGHYDVVPAFAPEQFEPRVEDGRLIGRGSSDMKGGLAAIIHAARPAAHAGARIGLVIVPDEETGGRLGAERLSELGRLDSGAVGAIVAEPTWGTIWHACRGAFTLRVRVRGRPAHVGLHYEGVNAFAAAVEVAAALGELERALRGRMSALEFASPSDRARESIMLVGGVSGGGTNFNIVPEEFSFTIDRRPNPEENYEEAKQELLDLLASASDRGVELDWEVLQDAPSAVSPADGEFVHALAGAVTAVTGAAPTMTCCPGVLETRVYHQLGIPAVAFGPGLIERMHGPDEDVPVANLVDAAAIYTRLAGALALASAHGR
jgi:succinyl-diaminopimelate desuccinylase